MKMLSVVFFVGALSLSALGQDKAIQPLRLSIALEKKQVCFGDSSDLNVKLTNAGRKSIVVDTKRIGYRTTFDWSVDVPQGNEGGTSISVGDDGPNYEPAFVVLAPGESVTEKRSLVFDREIFSKATKYSVQIAYGQFLKTTFQNIDVWAGVIESNERDFVVRKCN